MSRLPRVVFMGSPIFALPTLRALHARYPLAGVVTQPDRAAGRGRALKSPPVKDLALELGLPVMQPEKLRSAEAMDQLRAWAPDLIVVAAYGQILRPDVLDLPAHGCVNVHASLLPRWRGAAPVQAAILAGDRESGVTIMRMDPGVDTGPILAMRAIPIGSDETGGALSVRLSVLGADLLLDTLPAYLGGALAAQPQPADGATYAPLLKKEDRRLDPARPAQELARKVRAFQPVPGTYLDWHDEALKVLAARAVAGPGGTPGARRVHLGLPALVTGDGLLLLETVQPAGRNPMPGTAFLAGARDWGSG